MYDMNHFPKLKKYGDIVPDAWETFVAFDTSTPADGNLPSKTTELIAVAVASMTQCEQCINLHTERAKQAGNSDEEIADAVNVATAMRTSARHEH